MQPTVRGVRAQAPKCVKVDLTQKESSNKRVFASPKSEQEITKAKHSAVPDATLANTTYCIRIWNGVTIVVQCMETVFHVYMS